MGSWDVDKAVAYLNEHAQDKSLGRCAEFVRKAVEAGGVRLDRYASAKDYGPSLEKASFKDCTSAASIGFIAGDVAIIQPIKGHPHGHMTMFNGKIWISDFKQHGLYPGASYRALKPAYKIYRYVQVVSVCTPENSAPSNRYVA